MKVSGSWLHRPATQAVCSALTSAGYKALFVGGCVRNALLGSPVADIDIATDAVPQTVTDLAEKSGFRVVPTGFDHGTVTILASGIPHEVTTFRRDVETTGRHAVVAFSRVIEEDAARRDFTMNALYAMPDGRVIDPLGGLEDLLARRVRFVGKPEARITEDYLRILRFFRFHAWYGDPDAGIDADGLAACAALSGQMTQLSRERVGAELRKLLLAPDPGPAVAAMEASGILTQVMPGASARALPILVHLEEGVKPDAIRRLCVLGGSDVAERLRLGRAEARNLDRLGDACASGAPPSELGYRLGSRLGQDAVLARAALMEEPLPADWREQIDDGAAAVLPVSARDLMPDLEGAALGTRLREIEARWVESGFALTKEQLLR